jgi:hypothetical protein
MRRKSKTLPRDVSALTYLNREMDEAESQTPCLGILETSYNNVSRKRILLLFSLFHYTCLGIAGWKFQT